MRYVANFREMARKCKDPLTRYRASEMARLLEERDRIRAFDYDLTRTVLDHIEVTADSKLTVIFFGDEGDGMRVPLILHRLVVTFFLGLVSRSWKRIKE